MISYFKVYNKATFFRIYFSRYFYPFYKKVTSYSTGRPVNHLSKYNYFYSDPYYSPIKLRGDFNVGSSFMPYNKYAFQVFFTYLTAGDKINYDIYWFNYKSRRDLFKNFFLLFIRFKIQVSFSFKFIKTFCFVNSFKQLVNLHGDFFSNC
jgi:hypothetical protein